MPKKSTAPAPDESTRQVSIETWAGCYDSNWNGFITPESFAHPAKYARGLIERIFKHLLETGMIEPGGIVVDPFGGIASGGIVAAGLKLQWFGCELEPRFHSLGLANIELHRKTWERFEDPLPVLVCGDSRELRKNLAGVLAQAVVSSPPFVDNDTRPTALGIGKGTRSGDSAERNKGDYHYGKSEGQLGVMPAGNVDAVVSSPPFSPSGNQIPNVSGHGNNPPVRSRQNAEPDRPDNYGTTEGQLGNLKAGELADALVTSPPYEGIRQDGGRIAKEGVGGFGAYTDEPADAWHTQRDQNNLGNLKTGSTFWEAARDIVLECFLILRPGGISAWVCKDFVRAKARVPFCDDWCKLLESQGFIVFKRVHASLVKEDRHPGLFEGGDIVKTTERKSFFRRLAEKKGSPRIDFEEVIFAYKPGGVPGHLGAMKPGELAAAIVSSPPFAGSQQVDNRSKPASAMSSTWRKRQGEISDGQEPGQLANMKEGSVSDATRS